MKLLIVRHAAALPRSEAPADAGRPLTDKAKKRMRNQAAALRRIVGRVDWVLTSPVLRASETADLLLAEFTEAKRAAVDELRPAGTTDALLRRISSHPADAKLVLVGHQPLLGVFLGQLTGSAAESLKLKKGAACFLETDGRPVAGNALISWLLPISAARRLRSRRPG